MMLAKQTMASDLVKARRLLLDAAENGSRTAIVFLISQYRQGGVLFEKNDASANQWLSVLKTTLVATTDPAHLTPAFIDQTLSHAQAMGEKIRSGDPVAV